MSDQNATRSVLTGMALLLATAGVILGATLAWPREHAQRNTPATPTTSAAAPPIDLSTFLPSRSEYPPGYTRPAPGSAAYATLAVVTLSPGEPAPAPCSPDGGMPAQRPNADSPGQLTLEDTAVPGGGSVSMLVSHAGTWKDLSAIRTRLAQCPATSTGGIDCTEAEHGPAPAVTADDVLVTESTCTRPGSDFVGRSLFYYGLVRGVFVLVTANGPDPGPGQGVFALILRKVHDRAPAAR